jgi:hypothetical protein
MAVKPEITDYDLAANLYLAFGLMGDKDGTALPSGVVQDILRRSATETDPIRRCLARRILESSLNPNGVLAVCRDELVFLGETLMNTLTADQPGPITITPETPVRVVTQLANYLEPPNALPVSA